MSAPKWINFDIEADGLLDTITKVHCVTTATSEGEIEQFRPQEVEDCFRGMYQKLREGVIISGHNIINYDIPAIQKVFPWFNVTRDLRRYVLDTIVLSRLIYAHMKECDFPLFRKGALPGKLIGSHKLEAWGYRLKQYKGDYTGDPDADESADKWATFNEEMLTYNRQDVVVGTEILKTLLAWDYSPKAIQLEHDVAWLMAQQERNGFRFNEAKARELEIVLRSREAIILQDLLAVVPPIPDKVFIPKRDNKTLGYKKGEPVQKYKEFNPNSRQQIKWILHNHFNYFPDEVDIYNIDDDIRRETPDDVLLVDIQRGKYELKVDTDTFRYIKEDPNCPPDLLEMATVFEEYLLITKRLGQLSDGKNAWFKKVDSQGYIHGRVIGNGCVTGRASHSSPNMAQIPAVKSEYGKECRELFEPPEGWWQVGVDASGLELRCLGHYMYPYDDGAYAHEVVHGDIHTINQHAAGLPTRDNAKTFIYGFLYGAGAAKLGKIVKGTAQDGKRLQKSFLEKTPAISMLRQAIKDQLVEEEYRGRVRKWRRKWLRGLDGRRIYVRSPHSALNALLQCAGSLICKKWIVETERMLVEEHGLKHGLDGDFVFMAWVHDEFQAGARTREIAELIKDVAQQAMRRTQEYFNFKVQLDTEGKIGKNWADCH